MALESQRLFKLQEARSAFSWRGDRMRRRAFLGLGPVVVALVTFAPFYVAEARQASPHRIGFVSVASPSSMSSRLDAFRQGANLGTSRGKI